MLKSFVARKQVAEGIQAEACLTPPITHDLPPSDTWERAASLRPSDTSWTPTLWLPTSQGQLESLHHGSERIVGEARTSSLCMKDGVFITCNHSSH